MPQIAFLNAVRKKDSSYIDSILDDHVIYLADNSEGFTMILDRNKLYDMLASKMGNSDFFDFDVIYRKDNGTTVTVVIEVVYKVMENHSDLSTDLWVINFKRTDKNFKLCKFYMERIV